jgi:uncharacterized membrane protein HdeD (DUF308 family)
VAGAIPALLVGLVVYVVGVVRLTRSTALQHHRERVSGASQGVLAAIIGFSLMAAAGIMLLPY